MTEQSKNNQTTGENQISEMAKSSDYERTVDEEELSGVSGAGIGNAIHGWKTAGQFGGSGVVKAKGAWYGLTHSNPGSRDNTYHYSADQAQAQKRKIMPAPSNPAE